VAAKIASLLADFFAAFCLLASFAEFVGDSVAAGQQFPAKGKPVPEWL